MNSKDIYLKFAVSASNVHLFVETLLSVYVLFLYFLLCLIVYILQCVKCAVLGLQKDSTVPCVTSHNVTLINLDLYLFPQFSSLLKA